MKGKIMGIREFRELEDIFSKNGVNQIYVKELSPKQDNDKNQIYIGDFSSNLPGISKRRGPSKSNLKRKSEIGKTIVEKLLTFYWLDKNGEKYHAPNTRVIHYFQYGKKENRISGFLENCTSPPDSLRIVNQQKYGKRILCIGVNQNKDVIALVINQLEDTLVKNFPVLQKTTVSRIFKSHTIGYLGHDPKDLLINELKGIISKGWHKSIRLPPNHRHPIPFKGSQGGGYTLEALMGIVSNSKKTPDKYGYEIKSYSKSKKTVSLMTPTADLGYEGKNNFRDFMSKYGKPKKGGNGRIDYTGRQKSGRINQSTGSVLRVNGYDEATDDFDENTDSINVEIFNNNFAEVASGWSFNKLFESWNNKHQLACYVPYVKREFSGVGHDYEYKFSDKILICEGTNILRLIRSIHLGNVFYDPGHVIYSNGKSKVRPQWRTTLTHNYRCIQNLYNYIEEISIS
ncbi:MvaI/BcnI restriction endonuclease family protein [Deltaproteobacteria bacterium]|nr:MvaI/BcnI restriction endonuclease family protein [Deltaproteobacteria bacterium]